MSALLVLALALPLAQAKPAPQARRPAAPPATATVQARVTDRSGMPLAGAQVVVEGPSARDGVTDSDGTVVFRTMLAGSYRVRAAQEDFITLEKELTIRAGALSPLEFALAAAPPAPEPPPPPPPAAPLPPPAPRITPGEPRIVDIPDLAERSLDGRDAVRAVPIGCSGLSTSQLLVVRDTTQTVVSDETDLTLYVVAGEAALRLGDRQQNISSGWFAVVPRGTSHTVIRRGRNPAILLSVAAGLPCAK
jgi:hypothetical protein